VARVELDGDEGLGVEVLDGQGKPLWRRAGGERVIPDLAVSPGEIYFLRVRAGAGKKGAPPAREARPYRLLVRARPLAPGDEEEPDDAFERASPLGPGLQATGHYGRPHDEDYLQLPPGVPPTSTLRIELSAVAGVAPVLALRDETGGLVAEVRAARGGELRLRNAPRAARLSIKAGSTFNVDEPWQLRLSVEPALDGAEVEPNDTPERATALDLAPGSAPATVAGFLWPGDVDLYRLRLGDAGDGLARRLDLEVRPPEGVDVVLEVSGGAAAPRRVDRGGPGRAESISGLVAAGDVVIKVSARPADSAFESPYTLTVSAASDAPR